MGFRPKARPLLTQDRGAPACLHSRAHWNKPFTRPWRLRMNGVTNLQRWSICCWRCWKNPMPVRVMKACSVDMDELRSTLVEFIDEDLSNLVTDIDGSEAVPTAAFQRVIQRAAIHVQSSGRTEVTGANVLVAIFAERESNAAYFLQEQDMTRYDAVNFIAHGVAKDPAYGESRSVSGADQVEEDDQTSIW